jgi:DDE superfamily endonuclease
MQLEKCLHEICKTLIDVPLECIINIDELALQHCTTSSRSYCTVNLDGCGVKQSKEQITVTLGVSASGEKFTTQVMTKSACPCALKNIPDISKAFGIIYDHQAKAWQDTSSYMCLLHKYNRIAKNCCLIFYILQDNCSSHVCVAKILDPSGSPETLFLYQNLCIICFPPNATSDCQPLNQGIIWSFKARFHHAQVNHLLSEYEIWQANEHAPDSQFPINDHTHLRNVLGWVKSASDGIEENII